LPPQPSEAWSFLPLGYLLSVAIEVPVLLVGLSARHPFRDRLLAGLWLTACTYPIVVVVLPYCVWQPFGRAAYLAVAESFAPLAECGLFWLAYGDRSARFRRGMLRDFAAIVAANLGSFLIGEYLL
jgi:hypothetical protein